MEEIKYAGAGFENPVTLGVVWDWSWEELPILGVFWKTSFRLGRTGTGNWEALPTLGLTMGWIWEILLAVRAVLELELGGIADTAAGLGNLLIAGSDWLGTWASNRGDRGGSRFPVELP